MWARRVFVTGAALAAVVAPAVSGAATGPRAPVGGRPSTASGAHLVLWDSLDSPRAVRHPLVGTGLDIVGRPVFPRGWIGRAVAPVDDESVLLTTQQDFFGADNTQGTVSVLMQKQMVSSVPFLTPLPSVFGLQAYDFQDRWCASAPVHNPDGTCTNYAVTSLWGDGVSAAAGLVFAVFDSSGAMHQAVDAAFGTSAVPVGRWVRVQYVWDLAGIDDSADTLRIYREGRLVARCSQPVPDLISLPTPVSFAGSHATQRLDHPALLFDDLMVFDEALTP